MRNRDRRKIDFEALYGKGENPEGFTAETANGTAHWKGTGQNRDDRDWRFPEAREGGPWQGGQSNRTGE